MSKKVRKKEKEEEAEERRRKKKKSPSNAIIIRSGWLTMQTSYFFLSLPLFPFLVKAIFKENNSSYIGTY